MLETGEQRMTEISHGAWSTDNYKCVLNNHRGAASDFPLESPDSQHLSRRIKTTRIRASGPRTCLYSEDTVGLPHCSPSAKPS